MMIYILSALLFFSLGMLDRDLLYYVVKFNKNNYTDWCYGLPGAGFFLYIRKKIKDRKNKKSGVKYPFKKRGDTIYVIQKICFKPEILEHTFPGNEFIGMDYAVEFQTDRLLQRCTEMGNSNGMFMPEIIKQLKSIIGEPDCYDGAVLKEKHIEQIFYIKASEYNQTIEKIKYWRDFYEYQEMITWQEPEVK